MADTFKGIITADGKKKNVCKRRNYAGIRIR